MLLTQPKAAQTLNIHTILLPAALQAGGHHLPSLTYGKANVLGAILP